MSELSCRIGRARSERGCGYEAGIQAAAEREQELRRAGGNLFRVPKTQDKIRRLCAAAGPEYAQALLAYLTTDISWERTCMDYGLSQETLTRLRRRFYDAW